MKYVEKTWGHEIWFENNDMYCGKGLFVRYQDWSSKGMFHYHPIKDETFIVTYGTLLLEVVDGENDMVSKHVLPAQTSFRIKPGVKHRFTAITHEGCEFIEASTTHYEDDTIRESWDGIEWVTDDKDV